ncbi:hypothetical protein DW1_0306 [Proteiniborus sp. DW1]|uniref:sugar 3,4-ketoisomerase n=1 Tax=Proteiniborus sp. DW1 TaxID=1889883 RepID=UPI00092E1C07|nr:FdtA/QdtA family cupin domain-containing protein [Proteiniborus sp. DW1]SCG81926.1 hypothetical protein DW1_0306 [Proteiniborus sp. DW1]
MNNLISLKKIGNIESGYLSFFEGNRDIPFDIKRLYFIFNVPQGKKRGMHAHKELKQLLWCSYGEVIIKLDNGKIKKTYLLDSPEKALLVGSGIWREMIWKKEDSILCVAASEYYNEDDYIRDYNEFLKYAKEGYWKDENKL